MRPAGVPNRPDPEASPVLSVNVVAKSYASASGARIDVLRHLAFTLAQGETGALIGPSGCGKTTLLRLIAGLDRNFEGTIALPQGARLGMVFQEPRLLAWRSVDDNVRLAAPHASGADRDKLFSALGLSAHKTLYPGELSLGLARRVAIARALAVKPDLLLLDEPFVSLDEALAARLRSELLVLVRQRGVTTLLVTHDIAEAIGLADRIFLLAPRPARIVEEIAVKGSGDPAQLRALIAARLAVAP